MPTAADANGVPYAFFLTNGHRDLDIQFQGRLKAHVPFIYSAARH